MYEKIKKYWDEVFENEQSKKIDKSTGYQEFDIALDWLCEDTDNILDFGCGNGKLLFKCHLRGTQDHIGIDLSTSAIDVANILSTNFDANFKFYCGSVEALRVVNKQYDAMILSNIIDNLVPEDAKTVLEQTTRIVRPGGKVFVKLNPYLTSEDIQKHNIKQISEDLLDDGLYLFNLKTEKWYSLLSQYFTINRQSQIYYPQQQVYNRIFLLENNK